MILVVDDDSSVTASLSLLLKQAGYRTATAASPEEALESLARGPCELVLQDMNFSRRTSGEEGMELLREIKRRQADLPVILITAWGSIELAVQGIKAGAADFVTKPWTQRPDPAGGEDRPRPRRGNTGDQNRGDPRGAGPPGGFHQHHRLRPRAPQAARGRPPRRPH